MRRAAPFVAVAALAGCGSESPAPPRTTTLPATVSGPSDAQVRDALHLPARVPLRPRGAAPAAEVRVVRAWLDELSRGQVARAARRFALPARFQNLASIALIRTRTQAEAITASLPCGAHLTRTGAAGGYVVYEARLTNRPGGACGVGVGDVVRGAIRVRDGRITEWYRLPDRSRSPRPGASDGPIA